MSKIRISRKEFLRILAGATLVTGASGVFWKILSPKGQLNPPANRPITNTTNSTSMSSTTANVTTTTNTMTTTTTNTMATTATTTANTTITTTATIDRKYLIDWKSTVAIVEDTEDIGIEPMVRHAVYNIGGIESIVSSKQTVVIKPAVLTSDPDCAPNPRTVVAVAKLVQEAGGTAIVAENSASGGAEYCLSKVGITSAVEELGIEVRDLSSEKEVEIEIPRGKAIDSVKVYPTILNCDVLISVPRLKRHGSATVTISLKNMMGTVPTKEMSRFHRVDLSQCIADLTTVVRPDLAVVDATYAMTRKGPTGGDMRRMDTIIASKDPVAADRIAAQYLQELEERLDISSFDADKVKHINKAASLSVGNNDLDEIITIKEWLA